MAFLEKTVECDCDPRFEFLWAVCYVFVFVLVCNKFCVFCLRDAKLKAGVNLPFIIFWRT